MGKIKVKEFGKYDERSKFTRQCALIIWYSILGKVHESVKVTSVEGFV